MKNCFVLFTLCVVVATSPTTFAQPPSTSAAKIVSATDMSNTRKWVVLGLEADKDASTKDKQERLLDAARALHAIGDQAGAVAHVKSMEALAPPSGPDYVRGIISVVFGYYTIGEWDKALAFATANKAINAATLAAIGEAQANAKAPGARATLLSAQTQAVTEDDLLYQAELLHQIAESFITIGATQDATATLTLAQTALDKEQNVNVGIPKFERQIAQARLLYKSSKTEAAQALLAAVEKETLASPYVHSEQGMVLFKTAVAYQDMGQSGKAKATADKAAPLIVKIESEGNETRMLRTTLIQQALAGQVTDAVARAKKGEYDLDPVELLTDMGKALGEAKQAANAKTVFTEALTLNSTATSAGARLMNDLNLAQALAKAGDKAGADVLFADAAKRIPLVPEEKNRPAFWALWVEKRAASDLPAATAHIDDTMPELRGEVYLALARAASQSTK